MYNNNLIRIVDSVEYLVCVVLFNQCACRTYSSTLTAGNTGNISKLLLESAADFCVKTSVVSADNAYKLLFTSGNASAAEHALVVVSYKIKCAFVVLVVRTSTLKTVFVVYTEVSAHFLKLAGA